MVKYHVYLPKIGKELNPQKGTIELALTGQKRMQLEPWSSASCWYYQNHLSTYKVLCMCISLNSLFRPPFINGRPHSLEFFSRVMENVLSLSLKEVKIYSPELWPKKIKWTNIWFFKNYKLSFRLIKSSNLCRRASKIVPKIAFFWFQQINF